MLLLAAGVPGGPAGRAGRRRAGRAASRSLLRARASATILGISGAGALAGLGMREATQVAGLAHGLVRYSQLQHVRACGRK